MKKLNLISSYKYWLNSHTIKKEKIVNYLRLKGLCSEEVVDYFVFENMALKERDFCPLYAKNQKCHDIEYLNCFFCACPHFVFKDEGLFVRENGIIVKSRCAINSSFSKVVLNEKEEHLDCSNCTLPHIYSFLTKF
ncbi:MAG: hypothetical protein GX780_07660 [Campylobacteraceae bacterium]|nr:hypothetical protein [Campylobacteraceae bacterium]